MNQEQLARNKHEFRRGKIVAMASGTVDHSAIAANLIRALGVRSAGSGCRVFTSELRVRIHSSGDFLYPDVTVICGPVEFHQPQSRTSATNPKRVIEVTSPATEFDDRREKFALYRSIETLEEYILVSSTRPLVESFYRQRWCLGDWTGDQHRARPPAISIFAHRHPHGRHPRRNCLAS